METFQQINAVEDVAPMTVLPYTRQTTPVNDNGHEKPKFSSLSTRPSDENAIFDIYDDKESFTPEHENQKEDSIKYFRIDSIIANDGITEENTQGTPKMTAKMTLQSLDTISSIGSIPCEDSLGQIQMLEIVQKPCPVQQTAVPTNDNVQHNVQHNVQQFTVAAVLKKSFEVGNIVALKSREVGLKTFTDCKSYVENVDYPLVKETVVDVANKTYVKTVDITSTIIDKTNDILEQHEVSQKVQIVKEQVTEKATEGVNHMKQKMGCGDDAARVILESEASTESIDLHEENEENDNMALAKKHFMDVARKSIDMTNTIIDTTTDLIEQHEIPEKLNKVKEVVVEKVSEKVGCGDAATRTMLQQESSTESCTENVEENL